jgi:uncharacterized membrane protein
MLSGAAMGEDSGTDRIAFLKTSALLALTASSCVLLYALRIVVSGINSYLYLVWNLFLAIVPYAIAVAGAFLAARAGGARARKLIVAPTALLWLAFYPNAPYIFTDFIHLFNRTFLRASPSEWIGINALVWYDIIMNAAFAFVSHFIGLASMWLIQGCVAKAWNAFAARAIVGAAIVLAGFGIYLGRFSRLNSWDVIFSTKVFIDEVAEALSDKKAIMFSLAFSTFIFLTYASLVLFKRLAIPPRSGKE